VVKKDQMSMLLFIAAVLVLDILAYFFGSDSRGVVDNPGLSHGLC
jgi:hypothetical protein